MLDFLAAPVGDSLGPNFLVYHLLAVILIVWYCAYTGVFFGAYLATSVKDPASRVLDLLKGRGDGFRRAKKKSA